MFGKKSCPSCGKKMGKNFNFCAHCGVSFRVKEEQENYGMLGRSDAVDPLHGMKLPFGFNKLVRSLVKQLEQQMQQVDGNQDMMPKGFKINIVTGRPKTREIIGSEPVKVESVMEEVMSPEKQRRAALPRIEAESRLKRLSDRIIYEITAPEVKSKADIELRVLAGGMEVKAYAADKCYVKSIPFASDVLAYGVKGGKVYVELKA